MQKSFVATLLLVSPLLAQQGVSVPQSGGANPTVAAFSNYGTGCTSSGWSYGANIVAPAAFATTFGNSNNNIPFSWTPARYQQAFLGTEIGPLQPWAGMGLRQDDQFSNFDAAKIDLAMWFGGTTFAITGLSSTFDSNFNSTSAPKTPVFKRRMYALPKMPPSNPTNPAIFFITIPFDAPYIPSLGANENLVCEAIQYGNTQGNQIFTYPLDAHSGGNTTRIYGFPDTAISGTIGTNYGMIYAFLPVGGATPAVPHITNTNLPVLGSNFHFELLGGPLNAPGAMIVGASNTMSGSLVLPLSLTPYGAPGCSLLASLNIVLPVTLNAGGDLATTLAVPSNPSLSGQSVYLQFALRDSVNALGLVTSNGAQLTF